MAGSNARQGGITGANSVRPRAHMATLASVLVGAALLAACSAERNSSDEPRPAPPADASSPATSAQPPQPSVTSTGAWDLLASGEGSALVFPASGETALRLFCPAGGARILVNVPAFRPIASEERLSFGSGGVAEALVADTRGDALRGGVSGDGPVPSNLAELVGGRVAVSYGAQTSGPHPAVPRDLARAFVTACGDRNAPATPPVAPSAANPGRTSACLIQDGLRLAVAPLRAIGTEPFWGASIEGRCVTYSHPEDQSGTRVWTRYAANSGGGGTWTGTLGGKPFVLTTRPQPGCSDGMSDRRYPIAVSLTVSGESRTGCAAPG